MGSCGHSVPAAEFLRSHPLDHHLQTLHDELNLGEMERLLKVFDAHHSAGCAAELRTDFEMNSSQL
jgi:hypothetical protein